MLFYIIYCVSFKTLQAFVEIQTGSLAAIFTVKFPGLSLDVVFQIPKRNGALLIKHGDAHWSCHSAAETNEDDV